MTWLGSYRSWKTGCGAWGDISSTAPDSSLRTRPQARKKASKWRFTGGMPKTGKIERRMLELEAPLSKQTQSAMPANAERRGYVRRSRQEVLRMGEGRRPFDYEKWTATQATPEDLAETREFLRQRNVEREASLAAEVALADGGSEPRG
jgi:hypothetical protein